MEEEKYANSNKQKRKEEQEKEGEAQKGSRMNVSNFTEQESMSSKEPTIEFQASKKRKVVEKTVVTVRIEDNLGKQKSEGPPSDLWSWRKYGQKPIKGSPFPRGYYKCSTSKGCLAKKQVERCRTDASMIIITYTSSHNHPSPDLQTTNLTPPPPQTQPIEDIPPTTPKPQEHIITSDEDVNEGLHYSSPISCSQEENPLKGILDKTHDSLDLLFEEQPLPYPHLLTFSTSKSEENDFYDELEELPTSSSFTSFMRSNFFDERILVFPS